MSKMPFCARIVIVAFALCALWFASLTHADQPAALRRIGVLLPPEAHSPIGAGLREGLRDLGCVEGKSISFDWRPPGKSAAELRATADDFVRSRGDLVVAFTTPIARAMLDATKLPVVFVSWQETPSPQGLHAALQNSAAEQQGCRCSLLT